MKRMSTPASISWVAAVCLSRFGDQGCTFAALHARLTARRKLAVS